MNANEEMKAWFAGRGAEAAARGVRRRLVPFVLIATTGKTTTTG